MLREYKTQTKGPTKGQASRAAAPGRKDVTRTIANTVPVSRSPYPKKNCFGKLSVIWAGALKKKSTLSQLKKFKYRFQGVPNYWPARGAHIYQANPGHKHHVTRGAHKSLSASRKETSSEECQGRELSSSLFFPCKARCRRKFTPF